MPKKRELTDLIDGRSDRREKALTLAQVQKVHGKDTVEKVEGNIELDVVTRSLAGRGQSTSRHVLKNVPMVSREHIGHVSVPMVGDFVWVDFTISRHKQPVVVGTAHTDQHRAPHALEGQWRHQFRHQGDNSRDTSGAGIGGEPGESRLYLETAPEELGAVDADGNAQYVNPKLLRMGIKEGSLKEPLSEVAVDDRDTHDPKDWSVIRTGTDGELAFVTDPSGVSEHTVDDSIDRKQFDITLMTAKGRIRLHNKEEDIIVENNTGDIRVENEEGDISVNAKNGSVDVDAKNDVTINTDNTVTVDANDVLVDTGNGKKGLAYNDHTHDYEDTGDSDGGGAGTTTKQTTEPNKSGTE